MILTGTLRKVPAALMTTVAGLVAAACSGASSRDLPLPAGPAVVDVSMLENRFEYKPTVPSGRVVFRVTNVGREDHRLALLPLPENIPPIDEQLRSPNRTPISPFAGTRPLRPGQRSSIAVDLQPGVRYAFICFLLNQEGQSHAQLGMSSEFRTPG